jgi:hypothetical protein
MKREEKLVGLFHDLLMALIICMVSIVQARITVNKVSRYSVDYCGSPEEGKSHTALCVLLWSQEN